MAKHDICFVGLKCYDLLSGAVVPRYLGGIEKLLVSIARGLAARGKNIAFITYDHGQPDVEIFDNITVYKSYSLDDGLPIVRFVFPRMAKLWSTMKKADSSIYVQMGAEAETGNVALGCQYVFSKKRPFIFMVASNSDVYSSRVELKPWRERKLYKYGLTSASKIISQTYVQQTALKDELSTPSVVMSMPVDSPKNVDINKRLSNRQGHHHVIWVGRVVECKRLELLFEVAKLCPDIAFDVVGSPNNTSEYYEDLLVQAELIPNIVLHGRVSEQELPDLYQRATLLACTSSLEGFPTTFLEAWSYGIPVITMFDPDGVVQKNGLGMAVSDVDLMVVSMHKILAMDAVLLTLSQRCLEYFSNNYTLDVILPEFENYCAELL